MSNQFQQHVIAIAAGGKLNLPGLRADFVSCYQSDGELKISINDQKEFVWFAQGMTFHVGVNSPITSLAFENTSAVAIGAKIITGLGSLIDSRGPLIVDQFAEVAHLAVVTATATEILAADDRRVEAVISNLAANAAPFYLGGAGLAVNEGMELVPGGSVVLPTRAAIWAYHAAGVNQSVAVSVLKH